MRPVLPSMIMGNVQSLTNKMDELHACLRLRDFRNSSIMCFTETWLNEKHHDPNLDGFSFVRADRDKNVTGKAKGGGVCLYINEGWCHPANVYVKDQMCTPNVELLCVAARPYYLPREFSHVIVTAVYIPPSANKKEAEEGVYQTISNQQAASPDALFLVSGDFNNCSMKAQLPTFQQCVTVHTRADKTLDHCYVNIKGAYKDLKLSPLGLSDHNLVFLQPKYCALVKRVKPETKFIKQWTNEAIDQLKACFETTDWNVFIESCGGCLTSLTETVTGYINFCVDSIIPVKKIKSYANNKPWMTADIYDMIKKKRQAFVSGSRVKLKEVEKELKKMIRKGKLMYKRKLEQYLSRNKVKEVWEGMKMITGYSKGKKGSGLPDASLSKANELNQFYGRFDTQDFSADRTNILNSLEDDFSEPFTLTEDEVKSQLKKLNVKKAAGPDGISPRVLKLCADQLCSIIHTLYSLSLSKCEIPTLWKTSCIIPVPKKVNISCLNDLRPVALTSHLMKVFERLFLKKIRPLVHDFQDPLQFAYRAKIGVDDALLYLTNSVYSHLENSSSYVRIMFFDFSSAFNTIQPHLLAQKLKNMCIHPNIIKWVTHYLTDRPQYVKLQNNRSANSSHTNTSRNTAAHITSDTITTFTGAPQGTVLSPFLFTLYTSDCRFNEPSCYLQKFSDDSAVIGCIYDKDEELYRNNVNTFVDWCDRNYLLLNVTKTKELIVDFRKSKEPMEPICIKGENVQIVSEYKYLGVTIDDKLNWSKHTSNVFKKAQSRLFFLRKLRSFNVCNRMLKMFFETVVCSVMTFALVCWGGNAARGSMNKLEKLIKKAESCVGQKLDSLESIRQNRLLGKGGKIEKDEWHPLHSILMEQKSTGRTRSRYRMPEVRTDRYRNSFLPSIIRSLNSHKS